MIKFTKTAILIIILATMALHAKNRDWKTGTIEATLVKQDDAGAVAQGMSIPSYGGYGPTVGTATATRMRIVWLGYRIEGNGYIFKVACPLTKHKPNVTVHGPVKYAQEAGKFYMLDEDGREFKMFVAEKALKQETPAP